MKFGFELEVSAGLPFVGGEKTTWHWEIGVSYNYEQTKSNSDSKEMEFPVVVDPRTRMIAEYTWWDSKCDVPYKANMEYTFDNGSKIKK